MDDPASLERRLARFRAARAALDPTDGEPPRRGRPSDGAARAAQLARAVDGEVVRGAHGMVVRVDGPDRPLAVDRARLASLPGQPPPDVPLVCLDTETTGLGTAAGTMAFLVGLGWWEGERFRQSQLLVADHADEPALLDELRHLLPPEGWLVTYNGRGFDWPLLVTRFRLARRDPPALAGHLDLLPVVRRVYRHRLGDARLRTVESGVLGVARHEDVPGWEIPGRYLEFLQAGDPGPLVDVVRHNDEDVRSLARLLATLERGFGDPAARRSCHPGDLAGLARAFASAGRLDAALDCLDAALDAIAEQPPRTRPWTAVPEPAVPWWSPSVRPDFGGAPRPARAGSVSVTLRAPWSEARILVERAHLLRRLGRVDEAMASWAALMAGTDRLAAVAAIQLAKLREHQLRDPGAALAAIAVARRVLERRRALGAPEPSLEADLARRSIRLRRRLGNTAAAPVGPPA